MNAKRRKALKEIVDTLRKSIDWGPYENAEQALRDLIDEEQEAFDNMPDSLRDSQRGADMEAGIESLTELADKCQEVCDFLSEFEGILDDADV